MGLVKTKHDICWWLADRFLLQKVHSGSDVGHAEQSWLGDSCRRRRAEVPFQVRNSFG
jgi:hypothetical protein